jgi:hypothetical protein
VVPECTCAVAEAECVSLNSVEYTLYGILPPPLYTHPINSLDCKVTVKSAVCVHDVCVKGQARAVNKLYNY